jgi:chitinase
VVLRSGSAVFTRALLILAAILSLAMIDASSAYAVSCSGLPAFANCTAYASGASVTFSGSKYTSIAPISNTRDCPPTSPWDPSNDNWWTSNGTCDAGATPTNTARPTATATTARATNTATATTARATATATTARATATATTARATATFTATATRTPTATTSGGTCTDPAWNATTQYCGGAKVSRSGNTYTANYCSTGSDPVTSNGPLGSGQPWFLPVACSGGPTATATATATTARATSTATTARATATSSATATATATTARATATTARATATTPPVGGRRIVGYFAQWGIYGRAFYPKNIETQNMIGPVGSAPTKLTHINYAFANIKNNRCDVTIAPPDGDPFADYQKSYDANLSVDGTTDAWSDLVRGNWKQMKELKARHPGLKVMMSIGGWSWSDGFYSAANSTNRAAFVASCIDAYVKGNMPFDAANNTGGPGAAAGIFDGIDLDWEYPGVCGLHPGCGASGADSANYTALLQEFRTQMNALPGGSSTLLTVAVGAGTDKTALVDPAGIGAAVNWVNLMTYDFFGAWDPKTGHHSALDAWTGMPSTSPQNTYYSSYGVNEWISKGVPASKLHLGIGFYGRGWTGVANANNGLNQTASGGAPCGGFVGCEAGISDYKYLKTLGHPNFYGAGTHWTYNGSIFWSYDDATSIQTKMSWAKSQGLGGALIWSLDGDAGSELMDAVNTIK